MTNPLKAIVDFFSPTPTQQGQSKVLQQKQQRQQKQQGQDKPLPFVPTHNLPPIKMSSQMLDAQTATFADALQKQVNPQARQSGQQLAIHQKTLTPSQLQQARQAHAKVLSYASQARSLLEDIRELTQTRRSQDQQVKLQLQKTRKDAHSIMTKLKTLMEEFVVIRQQNRQIQKRHVNQLQQIKTALLAQVQGIHNRPVLGQQQQQQKKSSTKIIQHTTQDGNKFKIAVNIQPDAKCCVAQALKTKVSEVARAF